MTNRSLLDFVDILLLNSLCGDLTPTLLIVLFLRSCEAMHDALLECEILHRHPIDKLDLLLVHLTSQVSGEAAFTREQFCFPVFGRNLIIHFILNAPL